MTRELAQRLVTAAILIPLFSGIVLKSSTFYFSLLLAVVVFIAAWEWGRLVKLGLLAWLTFIAAVAAALGLAIAGKITPAVTRVICAVAMIWWVAATVWVIRFKQGTSLSDLPWRGLLSGCLILLPAFLSLRALHQEAGFGPGYVLFLFVLIWAADSGAYFAGRRFGRNKLAPQVSPGKTWEGLIGGLSAAAVIAVAGGRLLGLSGEAMIWFLPLCLVVVMASVVGDLLESLFKRSAGVKDSSHLIPGHGGALDRIDSITAAAPAFFLGLSLFEWQPT